MVPNRGSSDRRNPWADFGSLHMDLKVFIDDLVDLVQRAFLERSFFFLNKIERKKLNSKRDGGDDDSRLANNIDFLKSK